MSYWWSGGNGGGGGFGGGAYTDASGEAWGQSLSQPFDQSQLPGFGTHFGSHAQQALTRHEQMVQTSVETAVDQRAAQAALEQGNTQAVAALVANNPHLGVEVDGRELYGAQALDALQLHQQLQQARAAAHLGTPQPASANPAPVLAEVLAQIGEPPISPGQLPDAPADSHEVFRQLIDTRALDAGSADLGQQLTKQGLLQMGFGADEAERYLRAHPQATFRGQDGFGQALTDEELRAQVASGVVENRMTAEFVRELKEWRDGTGDGDTITVQALPAHREGLGSFIEGAFYGNYSDNRTWSATAGQVVVGLTPLGIAADLRDLTAAARDVYQGREGGTTNLAAAAIGFLPLGDLVRIGRRAVGEAAGEGAERAVLRSDADPIRETYGPARESHPEEFQRTMTELQQAGVDIDLRPGSLGYSPREGEPGRFIFDPDASIGALRHERRHFEDVRDMGYPGFRPFFEDPDLYWRLEYRGYMEEVNFLRGQRDFGTAREILQQMRARREEILQ